MAMKKTFLLLIALMVFTLPAAAYASGCCCMSNHAMSQDFDQPSDMEDMPCHEETADIDPVEMENCLCDQGVISVSLIPAHYEDSFDVVYHGVIFDDVTYQPYSTPGKRLLRPPIT